jgi:hypothetical protein
LIGYRTIRAGSLFGFVGGADEALAGGPVAARTSVRNRIFRGRHKRIPGLAGVRVEQVLGKNPTRPVMDDTYAAIALTFGLSLIQCCN